DSSGVHQSSQATARVPTADSTSLACHNRAHFLRGAMRGAMPCNPTQLWNRLSPTWQTRIRADLTALFQEVIDAQLRPDYTPTSGPQGRHLHPPIDTASGVEPSRKPALAVCPG